MTVTHTGEGLRFWVSSADDKDPYLVDMTANKGLPVCACRDFQCRCQPKLDAGEKIKRYGHTNRTICKHVDLALMHVGVPVLQSLGLAEIEIIARDAGSRDFRQILLYLGACVVADSTGKKVTDIYETHPAKTSIQEA